MSISTLEQSLTDAPVVTVNNSADLAAQIDALAASGGGTILLEPSDTPYTISGEYGSATAAVKITSAVPEDPALINAININNSQNLIFEGLLFDTTQTSPGNHVLSVDVTYSSGIIMRDNTFLSEADGFDDGSDDVQTGGSVAKIRWSDDVIFEGNTVTGYYFGLALKDTENVQILDNSFSELQGDGIRMSGVVDTLIEGNTFSDFYGSVHSSNHDDMIQLWSTADSPVTENLIIRGNVFDTSNGAGTQTIFLNNEYEDVVGAHQNIVIEDNLIYNGHTHGITVTGTDGVTISNNTLIWNPEATMQSTTTSEPVTSAPKINVTNSTDVVITDNLTSGIATDSITGLTSSGNLTLNYNDPYDDMSVENVLVNYVDGGDRDLLELAIDPDSPLSQTIGSSYSVFPDSIDTPTAVVVEETVAGTAYVQAYDASLSLGPDGLFIDNGATFFWRFPDGSTATGPVVSYDFDAPGTHEVTLIIRQSGEAPIVTVIESTLSDNVLLEIDFDDSNSDQSSYSTTATVTLADSDPAPAGVTGTSFRLDGDSSIAFDRSNDHLEGLTSFSIALSLQLSSGTAPSGSVLAMHDGVSIGIGDSGEIEVLLSTSDGSVSLETHASILGGDDWHRIAVTYDSSAKTLALFYDGQLLASTEITGVFNAYGQQPLYLGGPSWVTSIDGMVDDLVMTRSTWTADEVAADYQEMATILVDNGQMLAAPVDGGAIMLHDIVFGEDEYALRSYTPGYVQDYGQATLSQDGTTATLTDNAWKVIDLEITITEDLMLAFDFEAEFEGEIHGIGFVSVDGTIDEHAVFQLAGTDNWGLLNAAWSYDIDSGVYRYEIAVGQHLVGNYIGLALIMDDDAGVGAVSSFGNIVLWREDGDLFSTSNMISATEDSSTLSVDWPDGADAFVLYDVAFNAPETQLHDYSGQPAQDFGVATVSEDGSSVTLTENAWKVIDIAFESTGNTFLSFDFSAEVEGEIHGIGFVDTSGNVDYENILQLAGTQNWGIWNDAWTYDIGSGIVHYEIALGEYLSGNFAGIVLIMDDDAQIGADSSFANIEVVRSIADEFLLHGVDFNDPDGALRSYSGQHAQDFGTAAVSTDGSTATLTDNAWKVIEMALNVGKNTVLSFDFSAEVEGDIHAIGFVDANGNVDEAEMFQLAGTQDWGIQNDAWTYDIGSGLTHYEIAVGQYISGDFTGIALIMDDDTLVGADSSFANIELF